jgi:hypothetical protein
MWQSLGHIIFTDRHSDSKEFLDLIDGLTVDNRRVPIVIRIKSRRHSHGHRCGGFTLNTEVGQHILHEWLLVEDFTESRSTILTRRRKRKKNKERKGKERNNVRNNFDHFLVFLGLPCDLMRFAKLFFRCPPIPMYNPNESLAPFQ